MFDNDAQVARESKRQQVIKKAVEEADRIIMDESDGTEEMTNRLTARLAMALLHKAAEPYSRSFGTSPLEQPIHMAYDKACRIIDEECPEDVEAVRNFLYFQVAEEFVRKVGHIFYAKLLHWEIEHPATTE